MNTNGTARNTIEILPLKHLAEFVHKPVLTVAETWPPHQLNYLDSYLRELGCKTIAIESHYIDRDFISDHAALYARCLRNYPNHCRRVHFFKSAFDAEIWRGWVRDADAGSIKPLETKLTDDYLGFVVLRPLDGSPVGRTVLRTFPHEHESGSRRLFGCVREIQVHLGPFCLLVTGLPFQQQDRGVSACATAALWSSLQKIAPLERRSPPAPAEITQAASRYLLLHGRAFPSAGLGLEQMSEAVRSAGFEPVCVGASELSFDKAQLLAYVRSEFPPVVCIHGMGDQRNGHAVCVAGVRLNGSPSVAVIGMAYREAASTMTALYVHDDRLGPYAAAEIVPWTLPNQKIATALRIRWPGEGGAEWETVRLAALLVPVPSKVRLNVTRMLEVGRLVAQAVGMSLLDAGIEPILDCRYAKSVDYRHDALAFGLSEAGNHVLQCELLLSRYVGVVELSTAEEPLLDILLDTTETDPNPSQLACVLRSHKLSTETIESLQNLILTMDLEFIA